MLFKKKDTKGAVDKQISDYVSDYVSNPKSRSSDYKPMTDVLDNADLETVCSTALPAYMMLQDIPGYKKAEVFSLLRKPKHF